MRSTLLGEFRYALFPPLRESIRKWPVAVVKGKAKSNAGLKEAGEIVFKRRGKSSPLLWEKHNSETRRSIEPVVLCAYAMLNEWRNLNTNISYQRIGLDQYIALLEKRQKQNTYTLLLSSSFPSFHPYISMSVNSTCEKIATEVSC